MYVGLRAGDGSGAWHMWRLEKLGSTPEMSIQSHSAMVLDVKYSAKNALLATSSEVCCETENSNIFDLANLKFH